MSIVYDARHSQAVIICDDFAAFIAARVAPREATLSGLMSVDAFLSQERHLR